MYKSYRFKIDSIANKYGIYVKIGDRLSLIDRVMLLKKHKRLVHAEDVITYQDIYVAYEKYEMSNRTDVRSLKELISSSLRIRDFVNYERWTQEYLERFAKDNKNNPYKLALCEIKNELVLLRDEINTKKHIVVNWIDALRYDELEKLPFINSLSWESVKYTNMYTASPYTSATVATLLTGKQLIEDGLYENTLEECENGRLFQVINLYGYDMKASSVMKKWGRYQSEYVKDLVERWSKGGRADIPSTIMQFDACCLLAESSSPLLMFIHDLGETHPPFSSPYTKNVIDGNLAINDAIKYSQQLNQISDSQKYIDEQLKFYYDMYSNVKTLIYMADHGYWRGGSDFEADGWFHVPFFIKSNHENSIISNVHSLKEFPDIIECIMNEKIDLLANLNTRGYVLVEHDDVYSPTEVNEIIERGKNGTLYSKYYHIQFRAIVTNEDVLIRFFTGEQLYYRKDTTGNLIDVEEFRDRVDSLRDECTGEFIDSWKSDRYLACRKLYEHWGYIR